MFTRMVQESSFGDPRWWRAVWTMLRSSSKQFKELHRILNQKHQGPRTTAAGVLHSSKGPGSRGPACPCTWEEHRFSRSGVAAVAAAAAAAAATVAEVLEEMFYLQGSQALHVLENSLRKHLPESLKVYGTVFHMNQGNLFNLKALVDKWPDFNTVVIRPQEQDMTDDFDHYTNTYLIYSKDPNHCQEFLASSEVINWKQHLQIQSTQPSLGKVIENLGAINLGKVKHTQCFLYMIFQTAKKLSPSLADEKNFVVSSDKPKPIDHKLFKFASLDVTHAALVNSVWHFGGNEKSQKFIERCILTFPSSCIMGPEGTPVSWGLMDHTGELRMGGTLPKYRRQGLIYHLACHQIQTLGNLGFPMYAHVDKANFTIQRMVALLRHVPMPCTWNQWNCVPL